MGTTLLNIVTTFDGTKALKVNCRYIKGQYYEMNRQCFFMSDGKWNRINNGKIVYDNRKEEWTFNNNPSVELGIIGGTPDNVKTGYFTVDFSDIRVSFNETYIPLLNNSLIKKLDLIEDIGTGLFYLRKDCIVDSDKNYTGRKAIYPYNAQLEYNSKKNLEFYLENSKKFKFNKKINFYEEELSNVSFGVEFETWNGTIPMRLLPELALIPLKDGSLRHDGLMSYEYATIPLSGSKGLAKLKENCDALNKYTEISTMCSTHLHIGGYEISKELIVSSYIVAKKVEKELYSLFPAFYQDTSNFKEKNYCGFLPNFRILSSYETEDMFNRIYTWLSEGMSFSKFEYKEHPKDPSGEHKWEIGSRYTWFNMVPFIWGTSRTIEFRMHPPTLNFIKIVNWLFICNAILRYANLNKHAWKDIKKELSLFEIFKSVYPNRLARYLDSYITNLKVNRLRYDGTMDFTGVQWCKEDEKFDFTESYVLTSKFE